MDEFNGEGAPSAPETPVVAENPVQNPVSMEDTMSSVWDKLNEPSQKRDEGGKFAAETPTEGAVPAAEVQKNDQPLKEAPEPVKTSAIEAPNSWSAEMKAEFGAVSPKVQAYIAQREAEAHPAITQKGEQIKAFEPIRQTLDQHREVFAKNGVSESEGVQRLLQADRFLESNPTQAIQWLANHYGVDLRQFSTGNPQQDQSPSSEVVQLRRELAEIRNSFTAQQRNQQMSEQATVAKSIEDFAKDKPHFETVRKMMGALIQAGEAADLDDAYNKAIYAHPEIRQAIISEQQKADEEKRRKEQEEAVKKAKNAASINQRSNQGKSPVTPATMEETMGQVYDRLMNG